VKKLKKRRSSKKKLQEKLFKNQHREMGYQPMVLDVKEKKPFFM
jgi:hypothetical protein